MRIKVNNKSEIVYLVQIIDDASRLIVGQALTFHDNAVFFQKVLKKAVKTYGIPKVLYVDNGSPYANEQLSLICANLGTKHSAIGTTPKERFMRDFSNISRKTDIQIDECFLHRSIRLVKSDATISFNNTIYEVPQQFIKKYITIKYNPEDLSELYIYNDKNERLHTIKSIDKISNSKYKRQEIFNLYRQEDN